MKKLILLAVTFLALVACKDDTEFNTPSFEATKNNALWKAGGQVAYSDADGNFNIKGEIGTEVVILTVPTRAVGEYDISSTTDAKATFTDLDGTFYSTEFEPDETLTVYPVGGTIIIDELSIERGTATGRFQFSAFTEDGLKGIVFSGNANKDNDAKRYGVFYRVNSGIAPVGSGQTGSAFACTLAVTNYQQALIAYAPIDPLDPTYATVCATFQDSIENRIVQCGDASGILQMLVDGLGTCQPGQGSTEDCIDALVLAVNAEFILSNLEISNPNYSTACNTYKQYLEDVITECGDITGDIQAIIDDLGTCM